MRSEELTNGVCSHHVSHILGNHVRHEHPVVLCLLSVHRLPLIFPRLWFKFEFFSSAPRGTISGTGEILQERDILETLWNMARHRSRRFLT